MIRFRSLLLPAKECHPRHTKGIRIRYVNTTTRNSAQRLTMPDSFACFHKGSCGRQYAHDRHLCCYRNPPSRTPSPKPSQQNASYRGHDLFARVYFLRTQTSSQLTQEISSVEVYLYRPSLRLQSFQKPVRTISLRSSSFNILLVQPLLRCSVKCYCASWAPKAEPPSHFDHPPKPSVPRLVLLITSHLSA